MLSLFALIENDAILHTPEVNAENIIFALGGV